MLESLSALHPRSLAHLARHLTALIERRLWLKILIAMFLGVAIGFALGPSTGWVERDVARDVGEWLALPGTLFLGIVQMIVVPLVFASIIRGLAASSDMSQLRRLGTRLAPYFVVTTLVAVTLGLVVGYVVSPGTSGDVESLRAAMSSSPPPMDLPADGAAFASFPEAVRSLLPANPLGAMVEGQMLQIVIFAIVIGIALLAMAPAQSKPLLELMGSLQEVCMTVVRWAMLLAPLAVFGLLARITATIGTHALLGVGAYVATVLIGLVALLLFYMLAVAILARRGPLSFLKSVREVQLLAFSTSSSAAVMPLSIKTAEDELGVRPSVAQTVVPLGATINMDGTALYQAVATVFLAQVTGVELSFATLVLVVITAVGASIGAPSTPGVGIVLLAMILRNAGIPVEAIALIVGVDRILDMSRTAVNVTGDLAACLVMDRWVGGELSAEEERSAQADRDAARQSSGQDVIVAEPA